MSKQDKLKDIVKEQVKNITGVENVDQSLQDVIKQATFPNHETLRPMSTFDINTYNVRQSILWTNLIWRISLDVIRNTRFTSAFGRFVQQLEVGGDVQETFINLKDTINRNTLNNANLFTMYPDDVRVAWHRLNVEWAIPTTYREPEVRKVVSDWGTLTSFVGTIIANLTHTFEFRFQNVAKQLLFNSYNTGQIQASVTTDPRLNEESSTIFAVSLLAKIDDMMTEPSERDLAQNLITTTPPQPPIYGLSEQQPLVITFNDYVRSTEFWNALKYHFGNSSLTGNNNTDWTRNVIMLNSLDFPTTMGDIGNETAAAFTARATANGFSGAPVISGTPVTGELAAFIVDPEFFLFYSQFNIMMEFANAMTLNVQQVLHTDMLLSLSPFKKAHAFVI